MNKERDIILVTGATGNQGGATARQLLSKGFRVRALTRNPDSSKAQALARLGAEVVRGDYDDLRLPLLDGHLLSPEPALLSPTKGPDDCPLPDHAGSPRVPDRALLPKSPGKPRRAVRFNCSDMQLNMPQVGLQPIVNIGNYKKARLLDSHTEVRNGNDTENGNCDRRLTRYRSRSGKCLPGWCMAWRACRSAPRSRWQSSSRWRGKGKASKDSVASPAATTK